MTLYVFSGMSDPFISYDICSFYPQYSIALLPLYTAYSIGILKWKMVLVAVPTMQPLTDFIIPVWLCYCSVSDIHIIIYSQ